MRQPRAYAAALLLAAAAVYAQDAPWGPEAAGLRASIEMPATALRVGDAFVVRVRFRNISEKPTGLYYRDYHAGAKFVIRDEKGEPVLCMMACVDKAWADPKTFFHALKPGETFSVEVRGRVRYQFVDAARRPANDADREVYIGFSDETFGPVRGGKFTVALRYAVDEKSAELGRKLGFDPVWTGEVTSDTIEFGIRGMTREELDANVARLKGGSAAEKLEAAEVAGANADLKASRALMAMLAAGGGKDLWQVAEALHAVQDTSLVGELKEIYRRSLKEGERGPSDRPNVILNAIRGLEPDRAKLNAFLVEVMQSDAPVAVRTFAMNGLSLERDDEALAAVVAVAKKPEPEMQMSALNLLGFLGARLSAEEKAKATRPLVEVLKSDPDPGVRSRAALALQLSCDPAAAPALVEALSDKDPGVGIHAAFALGALAGPDAIAPLEAWAKGKSAPFQDSARRAIDAIRKRHPATPP